MGIAKKNRKYAQMKRVIGQRDARLKKNQIKGEVEATKKQKGDHVVREMYESCSKPVVIHAHSPMLPVLNGPPLSSFNTTLLLRLPTPSSSIPTFSPTLSSTSSTCSPP